MIKRITMALALAFPLTAMAAVAQFPLPPPDGGGNIVEQFPLPPPDGGGNIVEQFPLPPPDGGGNIVLI